MMMMTMTIILLINIMKWSWTKGHQGPWRKSWSSALKTRASGPGFTPGSVSMSHPSTFHHGAAHGCTGDNITPSRNVKSERECLRVTLLEEWLWNRLQFWRRAFILHLWQRQIPLAAALSRPALPGACISYGGSHTSPPRTPTQAREGPVTPLPWGNGDEGITIITMA